MIVFKEIIYFMDKILLNAQTIFKLDSDRGSLWISGLRFTMEDKNLK
jgi:hypothetical protein